MKRGPALRGAIWHVEYRAKNRVGAWRTRTLSTGVKSPLGPRRLLWRRRMPLGAPWRGMRWAATTPQPRAMITSLGSRSHETTA